MIKLIELNKTCVACPTMWEGKTDKGERFFARFRWGILRAELNNKTFYEEQIGDEYDGVMETDELVNILKLDVDQVLIDKNITDWDKAWDNFEKFVKELHEIKEQNNATHRGEI